MIGTIRKHQQWLWAIIITVTIASFLFWNGSRSSHDSGARGAGDFGSVGGEKVTKDDYINARNEVLLQYFFMSGGNRYDETVAKKANFNLEQRLYMRLFLIQKMEQYGIRVNSEKAGQFATRMVQSIERNNSMDPNTFVKQYILDPQGLTFEDFDRFAKHEIGIQELIATVGLGGELITPQEAQELYRREHQQLSAEAVIFSASNYLAGISVTPEALSQFYSNRQALYRIPERVQVAYVRFPYTNYYAKIEKDITNLTELVEANYQRLGTNKLGDAKTPEENKAKIREEILRRAADPLAKREASQFAAPLFENNPLPLAEFPKLAKSNNVEVATSEPFAAGEAPKGLDIDREAAKLAFNLSPSEPYSQLMVGHDGIYLMVFEKRLPSELPSFEQIKDKVTLDYKMVQGIMQAQKAGTEFAQSVSNGIAQGKSFDAIAAEARVKVMQLPPLALTTETVTNLDENVPAETLKEVAFTTQPGKVSPFRPMRQGGFIVYVKSKLPLDEAKMKTELPAFTAYVRQRREREAFDSWFRKEIERAHIDAPVLRR